MIIPFEKLNQYDFSLTNISVLYQEPAYRSFHTDCRRHNGFVYLTHGECVYESGTKKIQLKPESLLYLPSGSKHSMTVKGESIKFYRIDFSITIDGEIALFSNSPQKITDTVSSKFKSRVAELVEECRFENNTVSKMEKMAGVLAALQEHPSNLYKSKIGPAIKYLDEHFTEPIDCARLASLCFLSTAQFYNVFNARFSITPLQYRNRLLLRQAKTLLESNEFSVAEISDMLGFSSVAYFSRFFKKNEGIPPTEYLKRG